MTLKDGNLILPCTENITIIGKTQEDVKKSMIEMIKAVLA